MHDPIIGPESALGELASEALIKQLRDLAGEERRVQAAFLLHLEEFDRRRAYLDAGYGSLWDWCIWDLHLSEGAAGRRIGAMKVVRRFPRIVDAIRDGRLSLSTATLLGTILTGENFDSVVAQAAYKSRADVNHLVATVKPCEDAIRKLPSSAPSRGVVVVAARPTESEAGSNIGLFASAPAIPETELRRATVEATDGPPTSAGAEHRPVAPHVELRPAAPRAEIRPVAQDQWSVRVTLDTASKQELELLQHLLSHKCGHDLAAALREAIRCGIEKHGKRRGAVPTKQRNAQQDKGEPSDPGTTPRSDSARDPIPAAVKQAVYNRDGGSCAFVAANGKRCGSKWKLEFDHVHSAFLGGPPTIENVRLLCRSHNVHHAEQVFGREHMDKFRTSAQVAGAGQG